MNVVPVALPICGEPVISVEVAFVDVELSDHTWIMKSDDVALVVDAFVPVTILITFRLPVGCLLVTVQVFELEPVSMIMPVESQSPLQLAV
jgi:hypothetical protein